MGIAGRPESLISRRSAQARWAEGQPRASFRGGGLPELPLTFLALWAFLGAPTLTHPEVSLPWPLQCPGHWATHPGTGVSHPKGVAAGRRCSRADVGTVRAACSPA